MFRRRLPRPALTLPTRDLAILASFFVDVGWHVRKTSEDYRVIETPGGLFGLRSEAGIVPRFELALSIPDALDVDVVAEVVDDAGGITMEPLQETVWGGWGFSFNDPTGNTWELGAPWTVTAIDRWLSTGARPMRDGPIVALSVTDTRIAKTA